MGLPGLSTKARRPEQQTNPERGKAGESSHKSTKPGWMILPRDRCPRGEKVFIWRRAGNGRGGDRRDKRKSFRKKNGIFENIIESKGLQSAR